MVTKNGKGKISLEERGIKKNSPATEQFSFITRLTDADNDAGNDAGQRVYRN